MQAVVEVQGSGQQLLRGVAAAGLHAVDLGHGAHGQEVLPRDVGAVVERPAVGEPVVERQPCARIVRREGGLAVAVFLLVAVVGHQPVLQVGVVDDGRRAQPVAPARGQPQRGRRVAVAQPVGGVGVAVAHVVVARVETQRQRVVAVDVVGKFARDIIESEADVVADGRQKCFGKEVARRHQVGALAAHQRTVRRARQREGSHRERLPMLFAVAVARAYLSQGREARAVGRRYVALEDLGRLHRLAAEYRQQAEGVGLVVDRHIIVEYLRLVVAAAAHHEARHAVLARGDTGQQLQKLEDVLFAQEQRREFEVFDVDGHVARLFVDQQRLAGRDDHRIDALSACHRVGRLLGMRRQCQREGQQ